MAQTKTRAAADPHQRVHHSMATMEASGIRRVELSMRLPQLQNMIKRDPESYREEFLQQQHHFLSELEIFKLNPSVDGKTFGTLANFLSHVAACFPEECKDLPAQLMGLLQQHAAVLVYDLRHTLVQALILLRNRNLMPCLGLLPLLFDLFRVQDKALRTLMYGHIVSDIRKIHKAGGGAKTMREIQAFMYKVLREGKEEMAMRRSLNCMIELYRRRVWMDARTVNVIAEACASKDTRVAVSAMNFFLGIESKMAEDEAEEAQEAADVEIDEHRHSKKTAARSRQTNRQRKAKQKRMHELNERKVPNPVFPALQQLHDPQTLAEKLFRNLRSSNEKFEVKLLIMNMTSRLIGCHQLHLLSFYSFVQRYLSNHQRDVTRILAFLVQVC